MPSLYQTPDWRNSLHQASLRAGVDPDLVALQTDDTGLAEGLYLKIEDDTGVIARCKWGRASFVQTIVDSGSHWQNRPLIANGLAPCGIDILSTPSSPGARP